MGARPTGRVSRLAAVRGATGLLAAVLLVLLVTAPRAHAADRLYFANESGGGDPLVAFANLDASFSGGNRVPGVANEFADGVAIDAAAGRLYYGRNVSGSAEQDLVREPGRQRRRRPEHTGSHRELPERVGDRPGRRDALPVQLRREPDRLRPPRRRRCRDDQHDGRDRHWADRGGDRPGGRPHLLGQQQRSGVPDLVRESGWKRGRQPQHQRSVDQFRLGTRPGSARGQGLLGQREQDLVRAPRRQRRRRLGDHGGDC